MRSEVRKMLSQVYASDLRRRGIVLGTDPYISGRPIITRFNNSEFKIGNRFVGESVARRQVIGVSRPLVLRTIAPGARLVIGDDCGLSGATVVSANNITIGDGALLGSDCLIIDSDFHPVESISRRYAPRPASTESDAVHLGSNVFVGARAIILPGVTLGDNSVVAAGSVVTRSFPANSVVAGSPAKLIKVIGSTH